MSGEWLAHALRHREQIQIQALRGSRPFSIAHVFSAEKTSQYGSPLHRANSYHRAGNGIQNTKSRTVELSNCQNDQLLPHPAPDHRHKNSGGVHMRSWCTLEPCAILFHPLRAVGMVPGQAGCCYQQAVIAVPGCMPEAAPLIGGTQNTL